MISTKISLLATVGKTRRILKKLSPQSDKLCKEMSCPYKSVIYMYLNSDNVQNYAHRR